MSTERRYTRADLEFRAGTPESKSPGTLAGYAMKFNTLSQNLGGFVERIAQGAVDKSIADGLDVLARYNHDDNMLLGRTSSGTVRLSVDAVGLWYEVDLPNTQAGRDLAVLAARQDVYQSSFAFVTITDSWDVTDQGFPLRTLEQIKLVDVAPVNTPAYLDTSSALRSLAEARALDPGQVAAAAAENRLGDMLAAQEPASDGVAEPEPHPLNERQKCLSEAIEGVASQFGAFDQSTGPDGAHYVTDNPFAAEGLNCASCAFYDGTRACEIVQGDIAPDAICKFWIIPPDLIGARSADDESETAQVDNHAALDLKRARLELARTRRTN